MFLLSFLGSQRRTRLAFAAILSTTVLFYLAYQFEKPGSLHPSVVTSELPHTGSGQNDTKSNNTCTSFERWLQAGPGPRSAGKRRFPYVRPPPECRTFKLPSLEALLKRLKGVIRDPDLYRLFENSYPNTLDTMVKWRGYASGTDEELAYIITGDIDAMWLRDSASQIYSYLPLLQPSSDPDSLASLWRGVINSHSRYITISPYCHSFQPPVESGLKPTSNLAQNNPQPPFNSLQVYDCKWELDSLASFLQISSAYYSATGDLEFFSRYRWVEAVAEAVKAAGDMRRGTYDTVGRVQPSAYTFTGWTNRGSETLTNNGLGNPTRANGMVRTAFRPSDDACIFQFLTPANMMWAKYLEEASIIMEKLARRSNPGQGSRNSYLTLNDSDPTITPADAIPSLNELVVEMRAQAAGIRRGIDRDAVVWHRDFGHIFAYEVDGFGGVNLMDDANVPSLLAMPLWNYSRSSFFDLLTNKVGNGVSSATVKDASEIEAESRAAEADRGDKETGHNNDTRYLNRSRGRCRGTNGTDDQRDYDLIYRNTRSFILSEANPYFATGPVISAVGGAHLGPGMAWPMAAIVAALTAYEPAVGPLLSRHDRETTDMRPDNDYDSMDVSDQEEDYRPVATEVGRQLQMVLDSTAGTGLVHETVNSWDNTSWTRPWFGWANGLFGELILRIEVEERRRGVHGEQSVLGRSWQ